MSFTRYMDVGELHHDRGFDWPRIYAEWANTVDPLVIAWNAHLDRIARAKNARRLAKCPKWQAYLGRVAKQRIAHQRRLDDERRRREKRKGRRVIAGSWTPLDVWRETETERGLLA